MIQNLVIVESPAKAKTIEKFLGKEYVVKSSFGHIRDLSKKNLGVDIAKNYAPEYIVSDDKKKVVDELKKATSEAQMVWLASDEDREGEAIAWHLAEVLNLNPKKTKRIVFHEITKSAILNAIETPRSIDLDLVNSQQARRVLDRLVGFELSPILWKKVKPALSAGRVQSVAVRLIVEREREIIAFTPTPYYRVTAIFMADSEFNAELSVRLSTFEEALSLLEHCKNATFTVQDVTKKPSKKAPAPPFTTSTLQQEASRKYGFSVAQTMSIAQKLYEAGHITYMRTDSVNLSSTAIAAARDVIVAEYGEKYHQPRQYKTKTKGAQEAHEAIRPTYLDRVKISGTSTEQKLYDLIRKRTIASQMSDAQIEKTTINIDISGSHYKFVASGEVIVFDGFLKVYLESSDDEAEENGREILPPVKAGQTLAVMEIVANERFTQRPPRYTEASLVKKLEELGIGRPSTYAPTISTIISRGYVAKEDRPGVERNYKSIILKNGKITRQEKVENSGAEKAKLFPSDIGMVVTDFLLEYFRDILSYDFTAHIEEKFDEVALGKLEWTRMIDEFYKPFHSLVEKTIKESDYTKGERVLGIDPVSGKPVSVRIGRYGPVVQLGEADASKKTKPQFASLLKGQLIETITLEEALSLFKLPRSLGNYENSEVVVGVGRFGPYVRHQSKFYSLKKDDNPLTIDLNRAVELIEEGRKKERERVIKKFESPQVVEILNGRWGPYISFNKQNYKIPKDKDPKLLTFDDCMKLIDEQAEKGSKRNSTAKKTLPKRQGKKGNTK
ncbi:MAG TPA: type I DNA topoisomerase [Tenuifilaceae bacterium]|jgi:DNA topoisomerase-1|nr:type I DNA topoisomerase [Bacteroidales bacterium]HNY08952.1 type I DNA topoisomerase [Tenuifilaceae bacterium]MBP8643938.1 type I DNA topoisomerase [Bacteroidales bacterium]NLI87438.1 type I DNA topoisomerase [Bacteroidales bacterium]HOA09117.1 type I DNA topoisomerase [Tenuifilaceae bacterium]